jgi:hypothetical protein
MPDASKPVPSADCTGLAQMALTTTPAAVATNSAGRIG